MNLQNQVYSGCLKSDILWSDPVDSENGECSPAFKQNNLRGCSYNFGKKALNFFLKKNKLISLIRGHEAQMDGYKMHKWNGDQEFPPIITIFSAANYCDSYKNKGSIITFDV